MVTQLCEECEWLDASVRQAAFGVFDGHGGIWSAEWCASNLLRYVCGRPCFEQNPSLAMIDGFEEADRALCAQAVQQNDRSGCCSLLATIKEHTLTLAHCGDCRAVLAFPSDPNDLDTLSVRALTEDHKPNVAAERERIEKAGGFVQLHVEPDMCALLRKSPAELAELQHSGGEKSLPSVTIARVQGTLSVSRAMCDTGFKALKSTFFGQVSRA